MKNYHESPELLTPETKNYIRALNSLMEEVEAVDWYQQRLDASTDVLLKKILEHNRNEEIEHACMILEWLRRNMDGWNEMLKTYLFSDEDIVEVEEEG